VTAEEVKGALRGRHPAIAQYGGPGAWTVLEEWSGIDVIAFAAWSSVGPPIVGYEVKVSRGDYRRELLKPSKRALAVKGCHAFYFATPKNLLTKEEKAYVQPEHFEDGSAFVREPCPSRCARPRRREWLVNPETSKSGKATYLNVAMGDVACAVKGSYPIQARAEFNPSEHPWVAGGTTVGRWDVCETCEGRGYMRKSIVETEAPMLWVPPDVGLVEVGDDGKCRTVRKAPVEPPVHELGPIGKLIRWASYRPDPRHQEEVVAA